MLELDEGRRADLAATLEESARVLAAVRYGARFRYRAADACP